MIEITSRNVRTWARLGTCGAFGLVAMDFPEIDDRIVVLTADLCFYSGLDRFQKTYSDRLYNCGIAEQNMIGVAAGFAKEGFIPFATTYATFASMRCADQVRVNMGYMKLPIKLIGLTAGLSVGILGATHISMEDLAVMRAIPNIDILSPADGLETIKAVQAAAKTDQPTYIRLTGTSYSSAVYKDDYDFQIGKAIKVRDGKDISIIATGTMVHTALSVADKLNDDGVTASVVDMHTIRPLDEEAILSAAESKAVITLEEHGIGGLGSAVNDCLAKNRVHINCLNIGISAEYKHAGEYGYLIQAYGLSPESVYSKIKEFCDI